MMSVAENDGGLAGAGGAIPMYLPPDLVAAIRGARNDDLLRAAHQYQRIIATHPSHAEALQGLGTIAHKVGELEWAARFMEQAVEFAPKRAEFAGNLGNVYHDMGRFDQAIACFRKVIAAAPRSEMAHNNLGGTLQERGDLEEAVKSYKRAVAIRPDFVAGWSNLGVTLSKLNRPDRAITAFKRALRLKPDFAEAMVNLSSLHHQQGDDERAIECLRGVIAIRPSAAGAYAKLQGILLEMGRYDEAFDLVKPLREIQPASLMAATCEAFWHLAQGDVDEFHRLYGGDDLLYSEVVEIPDGYDGITAFNDALVEEILAHPSLKWVHDDYDTTRRGFVYGVLDHPPPALAAVGRLLIDRIDAYVAGLERDPTHPFLGRIPERTKLELWATVLTGGGHHPSHLHEGKWLSGTYYVRVPASCHAADPKHAGWLEFDGFTHLPGLEKHASLVRRIAPQGGLLALFPSHLRHQTAVFTGDDIRIGLSFDVVPA